jgi:hypothetical protein
VITYHAAVGYQATNSAGVGIGDGGGKTFSASVTVSGSDFTYDKKVTDVKFGSEYATWKTTVSNGSIISGMVYQDTCYTKYFYGSSLWDEAIRENYFYMTDEDLNSIEIKQGDNTLKEGTDYEVEGLVRDGATSGRYYGYRITFLTGCDDTDKNNVTITYRTSFDMTALHAGYGWGVGDRSNGWTRGIRFINYGQFFITGDANSPSLPAKNDFVNFWPTHQIRKGSDNDNDNGGYLNPVYDADEGTISWRIEINREGTIQGKTCTIEELIPDDQEFVEGSVEVVGYQNYNSYFKKEGKSVYTSTDGYTNYYSGNLKVGEVTSEPYTETVNINGTEVTMGTRVMITIEGLQGETYRKIDGSGAINDGTDSRSVHDSNADKAGRATVILKTRLKDEYQQNGVTSHAFYDKATLYGDGLPTEGVSSTAITTQTGRKNLNKSDLYTGGNFIKYTLTVNEGRADLVKDDDWVSLKDELESGTSDGEGTETNPFDAKAKAHLATEYGSDWFTVTKVNKDGTEEDITSECELDYDKKWFTIKVPDQTKVRIDYYVGFSGTIGDYVKLTNHAYFNYDYKEISDQGYEKIFKIFQASFESATTHGFTLVKKDQWANPVKDAKFTLYQIPVNAVASDGTVDLKANGVTIAKNSDTNETYEDISTNSEGYIKFENLDLNYIYYYEETSHPTGYSGSCEGYVEFQRNGTKIADIDTIAFGSFVYATNNFDADTSYSMPVKKTINGATVTSTEVFSFLMKLIKIDDEDVTADEKGNVGANKVYTDEKFSKSMPSDGLTKTIKGCGTTIFAPVYFKAPGAYTFEISENDLTAAQIANKFAKDSTIYRATITVGTDLSVSSVELVGVKDGVTTTYEEGTVPTFNNTIEIKEGSSASWAPKGIKILKDITAKESQDNLEFTFNFAILENDKQVATGTAVCTAANNYKADINFTVNTDSSYYSKDSPSSLVFDGDDLGRHSFTIKEIVPADADADPNIDYVAEMVYTIVNVEAENGVLKATNVYYTDLKDENGTPQFVNKYHKHYIIPETGIRLDFLRDVLVLILAGSALVLSQFRRKKHRGEAD